MRARPVGLHHHFHILDIQNAIKKDTGRLLHVESIWQKLQSCYDLDALDAIVSAMYTVPIRHHRCSSDTSQPLGT